MIRQRGSSIFLSYSPSDGVELALKLADDLSERGHVVWLARQQMRRRDVRQLQIERAIEAHDLVIALLTREAVRRPDGPCLKEIDYGRRRGKRLVFIVAGPCQPPLGIYGTDWVGFEGWRRPEVYDHSLANLLSVLPAPGSAEGDLQRLFGILQPVDFGPLLVRLRRDFAGRRWALTDFASWLRDDTRRILCWSGSQGSGKSALVAHLAGASEHAAAVHFCSSRLKASLDSRRFICSVAFQLALHHSDFRLALGTLDPRALRTLDESSLFTELLARPLAVMGSGAPLVLVVDDLDVAQGLGDLGLAELLQARFGELPTRVRLLMTFQKRPSTLSWFGELTLSDLNNKPEIVEDVGSYAATQLEAIAERTGAPTDAVDVTRLVSVLVHNGRGSFAYAESIMNAARAGWLDLSQTGSLPRSLAALYDIWWRRLTSTSRVLEQIVPLLELVLAAREPVPFDLLARLLERDTREIVSIQEKVAAFFPAFDGSIWACSESLADWLCGDASSNKERSSQGPLRLDRGHELWAEFLLADYRAGRMGRFCLAHLPHHLCQSQKFEALIELLSNFDFIAAKARCGMLSELLEDYRVARERFPSKSDLARGGVAHRDAERKYLRDLESFARGLLSKLEAPRSVRIWTGEEAEADAASIVDSPTAEDKLAAFAQFVRSEAEHLSRLTGVQGFVLQQAYNSAHDGPVASAARRAWQSSGAPAILRQAKRAVYNPHPALTMAIPVGGEVAVVDFTPDNRYAALGCTDGSVQLWDLRNRSRLRVFESHQGLVTSLSLTPDARFVVSTGVDCRVRVWEARLGKCLKTIEIEQGVIRMLRVTADGRQAVAGDVGGQVLAWNPLTDDRLHLVGTHQGSVSAVALTPRGNQAVSAGEDEVLRVWELRSAQQTALLRGHSGAVTAVALTPQGQSVLSGGKDGTVRLWELATGKLLSTLTGHPAAVTSVAVTPSGHYAVSGSEDGTLRIWDLVTGDCLKVFEGHPGPVTCVSVAPPGDCIASAVGGDATGRDGTLRLWNAATGFSPVRGARHQGQITALGLAGPTDWAISGSEDTTLRIWQPATGDCLGVLEGHGAWVTSVTLLPGVDKVASGSADRTIRIWDLRTQRLLRVLEGHEGRVSALSAAADGPLLASGGADRTIRVWDTESGECTKILKGHTARITGLYPVAPGRLLSASADRSFRLWELETGSCLAVLEGHRDLVSAVAVSQDFRRVVSGSWDETLRVWDLQTAQCLSVLRGHAGWIHSVSLTPNGRTLVSASRDETVKVWDLYAERCVQTLDGHLASLIARGELIVSASWDKMLRVWEVATGDCLHVFPADALLLRSAGLVTMIGTRSGDVHFIERELQSADPADPAGPEVQSRAESLPQVDLSR